MSQTMQKKTRTVYRLLTPYRGMQPGDELPASWDEGHKRTLVEYHRAEAIDEPAERLEPSPKAIAEPPADKMVRPGRVKTKGA